LERWRSKGAPEKASALVIFAHGSDSGRLSPRNSYVAEALRGSGLATLLLDLLTPDEELRRSNVFDIPLLATGFPVATAWGRRRLRGSPSAILAQARGRARRSLP